jgi:hypothetical protein
MTLLKYFRPPNQHNWIQLINATFRGQLNNDFFEMRGQEPSPLKQSNFIIVEKGLQESPPPKREPG